MKRKEVRKVAWIKAYDGVFISLNHVVEVGINEESEREIYAYLSTGSVRSLLVSESRSEINHVWDRLSEWLASPSDVFDVEKAWEKVR